MPEPKQPTKAEIEKALKEKEAELKKEQAEALKKMEEETKALHGKPQAAPPKPPPFNLDKCFTYHPPTDEQKPRYDDLRLSFIAMEKLVKHFSRVLPRGPLTPSDEEYEGLTHDAINVICKEYVHAMLDNCPPSADRSAAIRCVRLMRNGLNDALVACRKGDADLVHEALAFARHNLLGARYQSNASIALDGEF